jgi:hypothetical protein
LPNSKQALERNPQRLVTTKKIDPLYTIFEQHLLNFQDPNSDRASFIEGIVKDYLIHMRKLGLSVPKEWEPQVFEELFFQVNTMLVKKIYGCLTINEYTAKTSTEQKKVARKRYQSLKKTADQTETKALVHKKSA